MMMKCMGRARANARMNSHAGVEGEEKTGSRRRDCLRLLSRVARTHKSPEQKAEVNIDTA